MTRIVNNCVALVCLCLFWGQSLRAADASHSEQMKWGNESVFNEEHNTLGLFSGVLGGQIVLAGGTSDDYSRWGRNAVCLSENAGFALYEDVLSKPLAYGASITLSDGILCIGGRDSSQCYKDVFLVTMQQGKLNVSEDWPPLPFPLSNAAGALLDNKVYLFGGRKSVSPSRLSDSFFVLDLSNKSRYNPQIQISAESETKRSIFREKDKTKRSKKESAQHSKSRNKSFVMTSVSAL